MVTTALELVWLVEEGLWDVACDVTDKDTSVVVVVLTTTLELVWLVSEGLWDVVCDATDDVTSVVVVVVCGKLAFGISPPQSAELEMIAPRALFK